MNNVNSADILKTNGVNSDSLQTGNSLNYTMCEFIAEDGTLLHQEGGLLARLNAAVPQNLSQLCETLVQWPITKETYAASVSRFQPLTAAGGCSDIGFSDLELPLNSSGREFWLRLSFMNLSYDGLRVIGLLFTDITEEKQTYLRLIDQAATDPLTNAYNRSALVSAVNELAVSGSCNAFIMLDIDGFKNFNDTFGHILGDSMLVDIVEKLRHGLRREDIIGRIGGDEFMICLRDVGDQTVIERLARHICVLARHSMPNGMYVSASLGIAVSPRDGTHFEELYKKADVAMYSAKRRGGDTFTIFRPEMADPDDEKSIAAQQECDERSLDAGVLISVNILDTSFSYSEIMPELFAAKFDSRPLWQIFTENGISSEEAAAKFRSIIEELSVSRTSVVRFCEFFLKTADGLWRWYRAAFSRAAFDSKIWITLRDINEEVLSHRRLRHISEYDELTGLLTRSAFNHAAASVIVKDPDGINAGDYAFVYFDIVRFKAINDMFGLAEGDRLLTFISDLLSEAVENGGAACRIGSDRFALFTHKSGDELEAFVRYLLESITKYELPFEIVSNIGIYVTDDCALKVDAMLDRAILAQSTIKGSYAVRYVYFSEEMRNDMLGEQEMVGMMNSALAEEQFKIYFQPQYDHSSGEIVGAEALVRWAHPERGLIMPSAFIPIFEKNGFIAELDFYVYKQVCRFLRSCIDSGIKTVPVAVNLTRFDIFERDFIDSLERTRAEYSIPVELIRIEITETAIVGSNQHVSEIIDKLHSFGYIVEMDDFGSGYSSLNVLKDIKMDVLKLAMQFAYDSDDDGSNRGGTILTMIVRMAKWLGLTVIAEGVENQRQADYMRSIGCNYIQGFYYARPMPMDDYIALLNNTERLGEVKPQMTLIETMDSGNFWNPESLETLIFSNYVGAAVIFDFHDGIAEVLRVNNKYLQELGGIPEKDILYSDLFRQFTDDEDLWVYMGMINRAIESGAEEECETWRTVCACGCGRICVRSNVRMIGKSDGSYLIYETIRNITHEKNSVDEIKHRENIFRAASEQINMYYWEYTVATKEMRPCFRCIRDLKLPPLVANYPEPAIEMGIFPPDYADMYRELHRKIADGVPEQEAVIPLTPARVPFRIRYTTEFDSSGKPVKAYGSATPVEE